MTAIRRRLFWKVYLTLLASLVAVAATMGFLWWALGEGQHPRWEPLNVSFAAPGGTPGGRGPDVAVYDAAGRLIASRGQPIAPLDTDGPGRRPRLRVVLPDGQVVLTRPGPPPRGGPGPHILLAMAAVVAGVGLAAYPVTARLTRRLEDLRTRMLHWGPDGRPVRAVDSGTDEVGLVARAFEDTAARVEALLASQRALLANASHELRSPLARLRFAIELWMQAPTEAALAEIERNFDEMDELVGEILLSSRLQHAGSSLGPAVRVDLLGLVAEEAAHFAASVDGQPVTVEGNAALLRRLLRNLLDNAAKHGGTPVHVAVWAAGGMAQVTVSDRGEGIAATDRARIFEPFYRPAGRAESGGGWGLGLSLVRQIAERHGGSVTCEDAPGGGTRFAVSLALAP